MRVLQFILNNNNSVPIGRSPNELVMGFKLTRPLEAFNQDVKLDQDALDISLSFATASGQDVLKGKKNQHSSLTFDYLAGW